MINRLRRRFIIIAMSSVTLVILLLSLAVNLVNFVSINADLNDMLELICENRGSIPDFPKGGRPGDRRDFPISPETPYSTRYFVIRCNEYGELTEMDMRHIAAVTENDISDYLSVTLRHGEGFGYFGDYRYMVVAENSGGYMAVFLECSQELHSVRMFALASVLVGGVCIALVYILVMFFSKRAIDPVVKGVEKQKQFITDAGHELKTPLTVINTSLKVLEMEVGEQKWIGKAQAQVSRMSDLVNKLVMLSRLDEETPELSAIDFDISEAVSETAGSFRDFAASQGHKLETDIPSGLVYRGDEYAVRQLVSILLDNAVKYSDEGGEIRLSLERARRGVVLKTCNACTGMDPSELDRLFDRFYRVEKSRSKQTGGFGVGLSIARSIAEAHKGSIRAECPDANSNRFTVVLR